MSVGYPRYWRHGLTYTGGGGYHMSCMCPDCASWKQQLPTKWTPNVPQQEITVTVSNSTREDGI